MCYRDAVHGSDFPEHAIRLPWLGYGINIQDTY